MKIRIFYSICLLFFSTLAHSELHPRDLDGNPANGHEGVYDDVLDITWLANANLALSTKFGIKNIDRYGGMYFDAAQEFTLAMNASDEGSGYLGINVWRLPKVTPVNDEVYDLTITYDGSTDAGDQITAQRTEYNPLAKSAGSTSSELAYHYYNNFGGIGYCYGEGRKAYFCHGPNKSLLQYALKQFNVARFQNIFNWLYWADSDLVTDSMYAFRFNFHYGSQQWTSKTHSKSMVWPVADGDFGEVIDLDNDGIYDDVDNCPELSNSDQQDADLDLIGDICDPFPENNDHEFTQCALDFDKAVLEIDLLTQDNLRLSASLDQCRTENQRKEGQIRDLSAEVRLLQSQIDTDADGVPDEIDECSGTPPWNWNVKPNGCHQSQMSGSK